MKASSQRVALLANFLLFLVAAPPAFASHIPRKSIEDMIVESSVVMVGQVTGVDASDQGQRDGRTRVAVVVRDVLHGRIDEAAVSLVFDGGELPGGSVLWHSGVPDLKIGGTYIMFLRADYYVSPFVVAVDSVLQVVNVGGREVVADRYGLAAAVSSTNGLVRGEPIAPKLDDRIPQGRPEGGKTARSAGSLAEGANVAPVKTRSIQPSGYQEVIGLIREAAKRAGVAGGTLATGPRPFPYGNGGPNVDPPAPSVPEDLVPNEIPSSDAKPKTALPTGVAP